MKRHINLLYSKDAYYRAIRIRKYLRLSTLFFGLAVFVLVGISLFVTYEHRNTYEELVHEKSYLLKDKSEQADVEAQVRSFNRKASVVKSAQIGEQPFLEQIKLLDDLFLKSTSSAIIGPFSIDNRGSLSFSMEFGSSDGLIAFLDKLEYFSLTDSFKKFDIESMSFSRAGEGKNMIEVVAEYK